MSFAFLIPSLKAGKFAVWCRDDPQHRTPFVHRSRKLCKRCDMEKPMTAFYDHPDTSGGKNTNCKVCQARMSRLSYQRRKAS